MTIYNASKTHLFTNRRLLTTAVLCGALSTTGYATAEKASQNNRDATTGEAKQVDAKTIDQHLEDFSIEASIETQFMIEDVAWYNEVDVNVKKGVARLSGVVDSLRQKEQASTIASTVRGVSGIKNNIQVRRQPSISGNELSDNIERALLINRATESFETEVDATDTGQVTLSGTVDSYAERTLTRKVAASVQGVTGIDNQISVRFTDDRPAMEIRQDILQTYRYDVLIDGSNIKVDVKGGQVTLSGTVPSLAEKHNAAVSAYVTGVKSVSYSDLKVDPFQTRQSKDGQMSDKEIMQVVKNTLLLSPTVNSKDVTVFVYNNGRTQLTGSVPTLKAKNTAERLARYTSGVRRVDNHLRVSLYDQPDDSQIKRQINQSLINNSVVESYEIATKVDNGRVKLSGSVDSFAEKWEAAAAVSSIKGVRSVDNRIEVDNRGTWFYYDPYVYPDLTIDIGEQPDAKYSWVSDDDIQENIQDQLFWSPYVNGNDVDVDVNAGVATLTGTVESLSEKRTATENALEAGAVMVDNDLLITND